MSEKQKNYYDDDTVFENYKLARIIGINSYLEDSAPMHRMLGDLTGKRLLDFGCGHGICTYELADEADSILGVDISKKQIEFAKQEYSAPNIEYRRIGVDGLKSIKDKFDMVVSHSVFQYLPKLEPVFEQFNRLLCKNGEVVANMFHPHVISKGDTTASGVRIIGPGIKQYYRPVEEISDAFFESGFDVVDLATGGYVKERDCPRLLMMKAKKIRTL